MMKWIRLCKAESTQGAALRDAVLSLWSKGWKWGAVMKDEEEEKRVTTGLLSTLCAPRDLRSTIHKKLFLSHLVANLVAPSIWLRLKDRVQNILDEIGYFSGWTVKIEDEERMLGSIIPTLAAYRLDSFTIDIVPPESSVASPARRRKTPAAGAPKINSIRISFFVITDEIDKWVEENMHALEAAAESPAKLLEIAPPNIGLLVSIVGAVKEPKKRTETHAGSVAMERVPADVDEITERLRDILSKIADKLERGAQDEVLLFNAQQISDTLEKAVVNAIKNAAATIFKNYPYVGAAMAKEDNIKVTTEVQTKIPEADEPAAKSIGTLLQHTGKTYHILLHSQLVITMLGEEKPIGHFLIGVDLIRNSGVLIFAPEGKERIKGVPQILSQKTHERKFEFSSVSELPNVVDKQIQDVFSPMEQIAMQLYQTILPALKNVEIAYKIMKEAFSRMKDGVTIHGIPIRNISLEGLWAEDNNSGITTVAFTITHPSLGVPLEVYVPIEILVEERAVGGLTLVLYKYAPKREEISFKEPDSDESHGLVPSFSGLVLPVGILVKETLPIDDEGIKSIVEKERALYLFAEFLKQIAIAVIKSYEEKGRGIPQFWQRFSFRKG